MTSYHKMGTFHDLYYAHFNSVYFVLRQAFHYGVMIFYVIYFPALELNVDGTVCT
jgi:hypothetical protein